ncbi:MAG: ABC transporter permease [Gemmatimonadota bacterium]
MSQLKHAVRVLLRTPLLTTVAILSLALGIGANAAIYSLYDQLLLRSLPVQEPDRLVNLSAPGPKGGRQSCNQAGDCDVVLSYPMFRDLQAEHPGFSGLAGHRHFGANLALGDRTVDGEGMLVSGSYFPVLGVRPALGRLLDPGDDRVIGEHPVAVLAHRFWQNALGGDPDVLNRTVVVNGRTLTVVGVAAPGFNGTSLGIHPDVFVPLSMRAAVEPGFEGFENRRRYWVYAFGRLAPGASVEEADAAINQLYASILTEVELPLQENADDETLARFAAKRLVLSEGDRGQSLLHGQLGTPLVLLLGLTGLVVLIACANIANLLLAKGAHRSTEMAVRGSLGASRGQLLRQLLTESLLLAAAGGVLSLLVAGGTLLGLQAILPPYQTAIGDFGLGPGVLAFTALVSILTGVAFGLYPAVHATRGDLISGLRSSAPSGSRAAARFRSGLVTAQIALSVALLVAAGLFIRSLANVSRIDLGLDTDGIVTFDISPQLNGYEPERSRVLFERLREELAAVPGATGVTTAMVPVLSGSNWMADVSVQGFEWEPGVDAVVGFNQVGPGYFRTLGIPLVAGREFEHADGPGASRVAVVNEAFVEKFDLDPQAVVGSWVAMGQDRKELDTRIVGLVPDARYASVKDDPPPVLYLADRQSSSLGFLSFYVRTDGDPAPVLRAVPDVMRRIDPTLPVEELQTLEQQAAEGVAIDRLVSILSTAFAVLATLLAAIGLYGVLSYTVTRRTREIGLRIALGAERSEIRRMVLGQVGRMLVVGAAIGVLGALALGRAAASLLFQLEAHDPLTIAAAVILLALIALAAGFAPAFRAARVDPMRALRYE